MTDSGPQASASLEALADRAAAAGDRVAAARLLEQAIGAGAGGIETWMKLSAMRRAGGDTAGALQAVEQALALEPLNFLALLSRAHLLEKAGDPRAGEAFAVAAFHAPAEDKLPPAIHSALAHARARGEEHQREVEQRLLRAVPADLSPAERSRLERFASNSARRTRHYHQEPTHFHFPGLPEIEFHDPAGFAGLDMLAAAAADIRDEFEALIAAEAGELVPYVRYPDQVPVGQWQELNHSRRWTAIHLLRNGERVEANARHCPRTMQLLAELPQPQVPGASPNAMFSLLAPRTRIPPHSGVANTRLVAHLALIVPDGCGFRCGATTRQWREGEVFVFDDTIEHEAWNDSEHLRVVLIVDLWPPALTVRERQAIGSVIAAAGVSFTGGM